ncbi:MAG: lysophospholipid acyltransferase family protein [Acidobacteriota bacterium]
MSRRRLLDPARQPGRALLSIAGHLLRWLLLALGATWRVRVVEGEATLREVVTARRPVLLSFWHEGTVAAAHLLYRRMHRAGFPITLLASQSRDGELVTRVAAAWRVETVRGSSTRGGLAAMRSLHRSIARRGSSPILIPDGPKGPARVAKPGALVLSQASSAPILPFGFAADRAWRLRSWDRLLVPKPFARVAVAVGAPRQVAASIRGAALERERLALETELEALRHRADSVEHLAGRR